MSTSSSDWWTRSGNAVAFSGELQGGVPHCVYAAIAGAVNYLAGSKIWTALDLATKHHPKATDFSVADTALAQVKTVTKHHHLKATASESLSPELIRQWLSEGGVVILSRELGDIAGQRSSQWHMFTLMAHSSNGFQVWDTNGLKGFLSDDEILRGFNYPQQGWYFLPHLDEDALVLKRTA